MRKSMNDFRKELYKILSFLIRHFQYKWLTYKNVRIMSHSNIFPKYFNYEVTEKYAFSLISDIRKMYSVKYWNVIENKESTYDDENARPLTFEDLLTKKDLVSSLMQELKLSGECLKGFIFQTVFDEKSKREVVIDGTHRIVYMLLYPLESIKLKKFTLQGYGFLNHPDLSRIFNQENELQLKIKEFQLLKRNWNGNEAKPFGKKVIGNALDVAKTLENCGFDVFPTGCDSIQFEKTVNGQYLEIEVLRNKIETYSEPE